MKARLFVLGLFVVAGCSKPEAVPAADAGAPAASVAPAASAAPAAVASASASAAAKSAPSAATAITHLEVTGKLGYKPSWSWEPTGKVPGKQANGGIDLVIDDLKLDPPLGAHLKDAVKFDQAAVKATSPKIGTCKASITSNAVSDMLGLDIEEPGCDVPSIARTPMSERFVATATGKLVSTGAPVEVHFDLAPGDKTLDQLVKEKKAGTAH